jgi:hypothetical protein
MILYGGMKSGIYDPVVVEFDPNNKTFQKSETTGKTGYPSPHLHRAADTSLYPAKFDQFPSPRYYSSLALVGYAGSDSASRGVRDPALILFGGYDGSGQRYLGDLWKMSLGKLNATWGEQYATKSKLKDCNWRTLIGGSADNFWRGSCGLSSIADVQSNACDINELFIRAWCINEYQTISNY